MKKNYTISVTIPLTLFVEVKNAKDEEEAKAKALREAYKTDLDDWAKDIGSLECEIVDKTDVSSEEIKECPYCGSENIEWMGGCSCESEIPWHCHECGQWFDKDVCEHEKYWHQISALLNGTSEEKPFIFKKEYVVLPSVDKESQGLSELEKPNIEKVFLLEGDGTMYYHFEGAVTTDSDGNMVPAWEDMHELDTEDLKALLAYIRSESRPAEPLKGRLCDIRKNAVSKIRHIMDLACKKNLAVRDFTNGESLIIHDDALDGNLTLVLDTITRNTDGSLTIVSSSESGKKEERDSDLDTDTLVGIADWIGERERDII